MIELKTFNEQYDGSGTSYDTEVHIEGEGYLIIHQLTGIFDRIYESSPTLFEQALLNCQYTEDHT